ncbi:MAG: hypothetical protein QXL15_03800, partial [Candidatus Korarchaeota archaeon]
KKKIAAPLEQGGMFFFILLAFARAFLSIREFYAVENPELFYKLGVSFGYLGMFALLFYIERAFTSTKGVISAFSLAPVILAPFLNEATLRYVVYLALIPGILVPSVYLSLAWKLGGKIRNAAMLITFGFFIFAGGLGIDTEFAIANLFGSYRELAHLIAALVATIGISVIFMGYAYSRK